MKPARLVALSLLCVVSAMVASAQIAADLRGRVLDPSGAALPAINVELIEAATNIHQRTVSSSSGDYTFTHLNPGIYQTRISARGLIS